MLRAILRLPRLGLTLPLKYIFNPHPVYTLQSCAGVWSTYLGLQAMKHLLAKDADEILAHMKLHS